MAERKREKEGMEEEEEKTQEKEKDEEVDVGEGGEREAGSHHTREIISQTKFAHKKIGCSPHGSSKIKRQPQKSSLYSYM